MATHYFDPLKKIQSLDTIISMGLTDRAYRVFSFLVFRYNSHSEQCNPSVNYMAVQMNKSPSYVKRGLKELRDKQIISNTRGSITTGSNMYRLSGTLRGISYYQSSDMTDEEFKSVSLEGSDVTRKTIKEYIKEDINNEKLVEPELPEGSGSKDIDEKERQRALKKLRDIINS